MNGSVGTAETAFPDGPPKDEKKDADKKDDAKSADAKLVRIASLKPKASKAGGPNAGLIHNASYVTNRKIGPTRVALLDDDVLHDIGRAAAHEGKTGRKAVP